MALEEDKGRNRRPQGAIARGLARAKERVFGNKKLEAAQKRAEQVGEKLEKQKEIVTDFYQQLLEAARSNEVYNILQGKPDKKLGPIEAFTVNNGTSIIVGFKDPSMMQGRVDMIQLSVDVNKPGKEIHLFQAPYGPDRDFSLEQQAEAIRLATDYVRGYRLYPGSDRPER
jgi:hypothetical protein